MLMSLLSIASSSELTVRDNDRDCIHSREKVQKKSSRHFYKYVQSKKKIHIEIVYSDYPNENMKQQSSCLTKQKRR